jgi:hypothetical protein
MCAICVVFYIGYAYHFYKSVQTHDEYFMNRINPAAFTAKTKVSKEMWNLLEQSYSQEGTNETKSNYFMSMLEE